MTSSYSELVAIYPRFKHFASRVSRWLFSISAYAFWSSDILTGNQTTFDFTSVVKKFWSSDILTGNQTRSRTKRHDLMFWSSDILTGNQTHPQGS